MNRRDGLSASRAWALTIAVSGALSAVACGGGGAGEQPAAPAASAPTDTADGPGVITGAITYDGPPVAARPLQMDSDPKCTPGPGAVSERLIVGAGNGIQNAFVWVRDGLGPRTYAVSTTPVMLDQKGCQYIPHVFGVQAGQTFKVANSDTAMHNVHAVPTTNREFNFSQPVNVPAVDRVFAKPEIGVPLKCDVHGWMNAYVHVVEHPFFAVTGADGSSRSRACRPAPTPSRCGTRPWGCRRNRSPSTARPRRR